MLIALFLLEVAPYFSANQFGVHAASSTIGLTLNVRPPTLPADGGSYSSLVLEFKDLSTGLPYVPQKNVTVMLSSSSPQIAAVDTSVVFPAGALYFNANVTTTTSPGSTTISAFAPDFQPASFTLTTITVGGLPSALKVFLSPNQIPPDRKLSASVVVEVVDAFGNPVNLASDLKVTLTSSDSRYGSLPSTLTIPKGNSFAQASFTPTYLAGRTTITASALGFSPGTSIMSTVGPIPRRLVVSVAPALILASTSEVSVVSIQLQDNNSQTPALAPSPVSVVLTSSDTDIVSIPSPMITIPAGSSYATVVVKGGGHAGKATITASAQGYLAGTTSVTAANAGGFPDSLAVYFAPGTLLPNNSTYVNSVVVELQSTGNNGPQPTTVSFPITVYARSSNNGTMQVSTTPIVIPAGSSHAATSITTTFLPGESSITVQSVGIGSDTEPLLSFGTTPNTISLQFAPSTLLSDGRTYASVLVGLVDGGSENPAKAPVDTVVNLYGDSSVPGTIQSTVTIPAGQTYARANFSTSGFPGSDLISATAANYTSSNKTLTLSVPPATNLGLYSVPGAILASAQEYQNVVVQLQDSKGNPEKTDVPVTVQLATQTLTGSNASTSVTIPAGSTFAPITIDTSTRAGKINITGFASGFQAGKTTVNTTLLPMRVQILPPPGGIPQDSNANLSTYVSAGGLPLSNAVVQWNGKGLSANATSVSNSNGIATIPYSADGSVGDTPVRVQVSKPGYLPTASSANVTIFSTNQNFLYATFFTIPVWIILIAVAVVAAPSGYIVVLRMLRARRAGLEEEEVL